MRRSALRTVICLALAACASADSDPAAVEPGGPALSASAFRQTLISLPLPPTTAHGDRESLIEVPSGYAALYRKSLGKGGVSGGAEHRVFLSSDGVTWDEHEVHAQTDDVAFRTLAFGFGRYFLAGTRGGDRAAILSSSDAVTWSDVATSLPPILYATSVNERLFALAFQRGIFSSSDGVTFSGLQETKTVQLSALAYGDGTYVAVGSGPILWSPDGATWNATALDCALPDACIRLPGGGRLEQRYRTSIFFGAGRFYTSHFVSDDGARSWHTIADEARVPSAYAGGFLLRPHAGGVTAWRDDADEQIVAPVTTDNPAHLDCRSHRCLVLGVSLLLVP